MRQRFKRPLSGWRLAAFLQAALLIGCADRDSRTNFTVAVDAAATAPSADNYSQALGPRRFDFPADHGPHPEFRDEWWYVTGNLWGPEGHRYGFQLTFFRRALQPGLSALDRGQTYMAHFALTDVEGGGFVHAERFGQPFAGIAGSGSAAVWLDDWRLEFQQGEWQLAARHGRWALRLELVPSGAPVLQGEAGLSRKNALPGNASYYYSQPRLQARGTLEREALRPDVTSPASKPGRCVAEGVRPAPGAAAGAKLCGAAGSDPVLLRVRGQAWLDREWGSSELAPEQQGWDWFALQLEDGRALMLYQLRKQDGTASPFSAGTLVKADGGIVHLQHSHFSLSPEMHWRSPDGASIPVRWHLEIPAHGIDWQVTAVQPDQYLRGLFSYWEGAVDVVAADTRIGVGYLEMTGYRAGEAH